MLFDDIIGNETIKIQLKIASKAARINNTSVPHILFSGAAGCGKTTMAKALAKDLGVDMIKMPPDAIKSAKDIYDLTEHLSVEGYSKYGDVISKIRPTVLFLDEIHKMTLGGQESLGIAMEEWYVAVKNEWTKEINEFWIPRFTVVGATTLEGKLSKPLRDRFKFTFPFTTYNLSDSTKIVKIHSKIKEVSITEGAANLIAIRGRGVPRILVGYLERCADMATVTGKDTISEDEVKPVFELMGVDDTGLNLDDIKLLKTLYKNGSPVGLDTLSVILNQSNKDIQNSREPYLIQRGLIMRSSRGRVITQEGVEYLRERKHINSKRRFASHG